MKLLEPFGPMHPDLGSSVAKHRRRMRGGLMSAPQAMRHAYADAVSAAIRAKQRSALQRELPSHRVRCASGTDHNCGLKISEAVRNQHRASLLACPGQIRRARTAEQWAEMYKEAMKDKAKTKG